MNSKELAKITRDPNAKEALERCKHHLTGGGNYEPSQREITSRIKQFIEEGEYKSCLANRTFVCVSNYNFVNIVEETKTYKIYRCDGGHHYAVVFKEFKTQDGSHANSITLVVKNGKLVPDMGQDTANGFELEG